jgi:hypothetical protein
MKPYGWCGLLLLAVSEYCLWHRIEPVYSWFYCFAWWSYILLADNLVLILTGGSLLSTRRRELARMLPLSVFIWLVFEGYNLVLQNWGYDGVPIERWVRWPGYAFAFATVLPGIFITADLMARIVFGPATPPASEADTLDAVEAVRRPSPAFVGAGIALAVAPLLWPRYFFPAVWLGPIFALDPLLERMGIRSLSIEIAARDRRRVASLLLGGLVSGLLWEFWNFWAGSKWIYSVPFFGHWKVFEMPVLGFLGFPPFAVECWILYHLLTAALERTPRGAARAGYWLAVASLSACILHGMDQRTVLRFSHARFTLSRSSR